MTETQAEYVTKTVTNTADRKPWRCLGCGEVIGFTYSHPRRLVIDTDNILFVVRGDAVITHTACGAVMTWTWRREEHGILKELETTQEIIDTEELTVTDLDNLC